MNQVVAFPKLKIGDPIKEPPKSLPLNRNPKQHDVVAWRNDGRIDTDRFDTKEKAQEFGRALSWVIHYKWALMQGRDILEMNQIPPEAGMALDDNLMPYKIEGQA